MADDSLARNRFAVTADTDADYDAIYATVVATERGRWFLDEYARRHHGADTESVLAVLARIEQAIHGVGMPEPTDTMRNELVAMMEAIALARDDVVGREGDPAARGEAAIADFRRAVEQIRELIGTAHQDQASGPGAELSFQANRLAVAGERLERSIGGLRILLGLLDELDRHLRHLVGEPRPVVEAMAEPTPAAADPPPVASPAPWPLALHEAMETALPALPEPPPEPVPQAPTDEPFWDLTVPLPQALDGPVEWERAPPPASPTAALERLEAREFGDPSAPIAEAVPDAGGFDDLIVTVETDAISGQNAGAPQESADSEWIVAPAAAVPAAEIFDDGLLNAGEDQEAMEAATAPPEWPEPPAVEDASANIVAQAVEQDLAAAQETPLPAMPVLPDPDADLAAQHPPTSDSGVDTAAMLERLESMRTAIAELMAEVSEKTPRRA